MLRECCDCCGFPLDMKRVPIILTNDYFSIVKASMNKCDICNHQKNGITIECVHEQFQSTFNKLNSRNHRVILFFKRYLSMDDMKRLSVCVSIPEYLIPIKRGFLNSDALHDFTWRTACNEIVHDSSLARVLLSRMDFLEGEIENADAKDI